MVLCDVIFIVTPDVGGLGLPTRFVSIAMLGNEIVVAVTLDEYGGKHVTCEVKQN